MTTVAVMLGLLGYAAASMWLFARAVGSISENAATTTQRNTQVVADAVAAVTKAVGESVQTAMAPPSSPATINPFTAAHDAVDAGWGDNTAAMTDDADPTDGNIWLSRDRAEAVFATNGDLPHGVSFPPPKG